MGIGSASNSRWLTRKSGGIIRRLWPFGSLTTITAGFARRWRKSRGKRIDPRSRQRQQWQRDWRIGLGACRSCWMQLPC